MKKRLLITSIVMMLVVAVALSTATYAWFTSSAAVTASTVSLTASSNSGASIGIAWGTAGESTSITAKAAEGTWDPMVPLTLTAATTSDVTFTGATIRTEGGVQKFNEASSKNPFKYTSTDQTPVEFFHVKNLSTAATNAATVTLTLKDLTGQAPAAITDDNSLLRVGVFASDTSNGSYTLVAVMGVSANLNTEWGSVTTNGDVASLTADNQEVKTVTSYEFNLAANTAKYFKVIAWMDGVALNDGTAGSIVNFGLNFAATRAQ